jgi:hypothetical protein
MNAKAQNNTVQGRNTKLRSVCKVKRSLKKNACASRKSGIPRRGHARPLNEIKLGARRPLRRDYDVNTKPRWKKLGDELKRQKLLGLAATNNNGRREGRQREDEQRCW